MNLKTIPAVDLVNGDRIHAEGVNLLTVSDVRYDSASHIVEMLADPAPHAAVWDLDMIARCTGATSAEYRPGYTYLLRFASDAAVRLVGGAPR
jgi:hypothetical protein